MADCDNSPNIGKLDMEKEARWARERHAAYQALLAEIDRICGMPTRTERNAGKQSRAEGVGGMFPVPPRSRGTGRVSAGNLQGATNGVESLW